MTISRSSGRPSTSRIVALSRHEARPIALFGQLGSWTVVGFLGACLNTPGVTGLSNHLCTILSNTATPVWGTACLSLTTNVATLCTNQLYTRPTFCPPLR